MLPIDPFHRQPTPNATLYRYVTIDKLLDFLFSRRITLAQLHTFADKLEGVTARHLLVNSDGAAEHEPFNNDVSAKNAIWRSIREQRRVFQETNYASCWYGNNHECVAMWQLYSKQDSVAIRIRYEDLVHEIRNQSFILPEYQFEKLRYGSIDYHRFNEFDDLRKIESDENIQGFLKDSSFMHEQEFRIILQVKHDPYLQTADPDLHADKPITRHIPLTLTNFSSLPFEIVFHPQSSHWHRDNIVKIIDKFQLPFRTTESVLKDIFS